jgi:hypothetical protein
MTLRSETQSLGHPVETLAIGTPASTGQAARLKSRQGAVAAPLHAGLMERELRLSIYEKELRRLLYDLRDRDFVVLEDSRDSERYVQYLVHDGAILGEVGSRHWIPESSGLRKTSVTALGCLGFEGGGPKTNFKRDHLPHDARKLACLTELAFGAAYGDEVCDMTPFVLTKAAREAQVQPRQLEFDA